MYDNYKVYGPYTRKDGRQIVVLKEPGVENRRTVSYPKYIVECKIGRYLSEDETVDHIDGDFLNNDYSNLRIIPRSEHCRSHVYRKVKQKRVCPVCGSSFVTADWWRKTCGSKVCVGKTAHILGYNKGNDIRFSERKLESLRSTVESYGSI